MKKFIATGVTTIISRPEHVELECDEVRTERGEKLKEAKVLIRNKSDSDFVTEVLVDGRLIFETGDGVEKTKQNLKAFIAALDNEMIDEDVH